MVRVKHLVVAVCLLIPAAVPVWGELAPAAPDVAEPAVACPAPAFSAVTSVGANEPRLLSTCTNCASCNVDADCGGFRCVPMIQSVLVCEGKEVCSFPDRVCSTSCDPCSTSAQCPSGESCIDVRLAFCIPEEECVTVLPERVCECF